MLHRTLSVVIALGLGAAHIDAANALVISFADRAAYSGTVGASTIDDYFGIDNLEFARVPARSAPSRARSRCSGSASRWSASASCAAARSRGGVLQALTLG